VYLATRDLNADVRQVAVTWRLFGTGVSSTVVLLGLTSLFTDVSTEMVTAILPLYLFSRLGFTPLQFGLFDGMYQGVTALVRVAAGLTADRRQRHKEVAAAGYALSTACKLGLWASGPAWLPTLGFLFLDRTGKGVRTAPRDALISLNSPRAGLAAAFGVHRALDTAGALLGPIVAFALLGLVPGGYDVVFVVSFCLGVIGVGILVFLVSSQTDGSMRSPERASLATALALLRRRGVRGMAIAAAMLSVATVSDSLVYVTLQRRTSIDAYHFPLLFVGTALVYLLLAVPAGRLADRAGRRRLFLTGHVFLGGAYALLLLPSAPGLLALTCVVLLGAYYAATDGVLMAIASSQLPPGLLTSGLALMTTVTALGRLLASALYGALWTWLGADTTLVLFLVALLIATAAAAIALRPGPEATGP
jgi:MFS family permease